MNVTPAGWAMLVAAVGLAVAGFLLWWTLYGGYHLVGRYKLHRQAIRDRSGGIVNDMCPASDCRTWVQGTDGEEFCPAHRQLHS